jgi:hypothetical protein
MSYQVVRKGSPQTESWQAIVRDYLIAQWNLAAPLDIDNPGKIVINTGWWQKQPQFIINVRHDIDKMPMNRTLGRRPIKKFDDVLQVHCWETTQTDNQEPTNLFKMCEEVERIINSDALGLNSEGIYNMSCSSGNILPKDDSQATIFHSYQRIEIIYAKRYV